MGLRRCSACLVPVCLCACVHEVSRATLTHHARTHDGIHGTAGFDAAVRIWNVETCQALRTVPLDGVSEWRNPHLHWVGHSLPAADARVMQQGEGVMGAGPAQPSSARLSPWSGERGGGVVIAAGRDLVYLPLFGGGDGADGRELLV